ncbi:hypothetical protein IWW45_008585, partial [Coemansia sp. RSA 485]
HCLKPDYVIEDSDTHKVVSISHPNIHGLQLRFLEFVKQTKRQENPGSMQVDGQETHADINSDFWIPYTMVAWLESPLPACALTVRKIMAAVSPDSKVEVLSPSTDSTAETLSLDSPRLLEDAPTLEHLVFKEYVAKQDVSGSAGPLDPQEMTSPVLAEAAAENPKLRKSSIHIINGQSVAVELEAPQIRAWSICRIPLSHPCNILSVVPLLRRQAVFNELLASCFSTSDNSAATSKVSVKTYANDPFRIDVVFINQQTMSSDAGDVGKRPKNTSDEEQQQQSMDVEDSGENTESQDGIMSVGQGVILRVIEATGDILAWTHQSLGISPTTDLLSAMSGVATNSLKKTTSHKNLSAVANISNSIPMIAYWLKSNAQ